MQTHAPVDFLLLARPWHSEPGPQLAKILHVVTEAACEGDCLGLMPSRFAPRLHHVADLLCQPNRKVVPVAWQPSRSHKTNPHCVLLCSGRGLHGGACQKMWPPLLPRCAPVLGWMWQVAAPVSALLAARSSPRLAIVASLTPEGLVAKPWRSSHVFSPGSP